MKANLKLEKMVLVSDDGEDGIEEKGEEAGEDEEDEHEVEDEEDDDQVKQDEVYFESDSAKEVLFLGY